MALPGPDQPQSVRFSDVNEEIEPAKAVETLCELTGSGKDARDGPLSPQAAEELRNISSTLQQSRCQAKRMENFSFEPVSLPPSRVSRVSKHTINGTQVTLAQGPVTFSYIPHHLRPFLSSFLYSIFPGIRHAFASSNTGGYFVPRRKDGQC
jgi:hypothetical protein